MDAIVKRRRRTVRRRRGVVLAAVVATASATATLGVQPAMAAPGAAPTCSRTTVEPWKSGTDVEGAVAVTCTAPVSSIWTSVTTGIYYGGAWHEATAYTGTAYNTTSSERFAPLIRCNGAQMYDFRTHSQAQVNGTWLPDQYSPVVGLAC